MITILVLTQDHHDETDDAYEPFMIMIVNY